MIRLGVAHEVPQPMLNLASELAFVRLEGGCPLAESFLEVLLIAEKLFVRRNEIVHLSAKSI